MIGRHYFEALIKTRKENICGQGIDIFDNEGHPDVCQNNELGLEDVIIGIPV